MSFLLNTTFGIFSSGSGGGGTPGPPFDPSSANNGLSVDPITGVIQLGNEAIGISGAGRLLNRREIDLNAFDLTFKDFAFGGEIVAMRFVEDHIQVINEGIVNNGSAALIFWNDLEFNDNITNNSAAYGLGQMFIDSVTTGKNVTLTEDNVSFTDNSDTLGLLNSTRLSLLNNVTSFASQIDAASILLYDNALPGSAEWFAVKRNLGIQMQANLPVDFSQQLLTMRDTASSSLAGLNFQEISPGIREMQVYADGPNSVLLRLRDNGEAILGSGAGNNTFGQAVTIPGGLTVTENNTSSDFFSVDGVTGAITVLGINGVSGTFSPVNSITVVNGLVTAVS